MFFTQVSRSEHVPLRAFCFTPRHWRRAGRTMRGSRRPDPDFFVREGLLLNRHDCEDIGIELMRAHGCFALCLRRGSGASCRCSTHAIAEDRLLWGGSRPFVLSLAVLDCHTVERFAFRADPSVNKRGRARCLTGSVARTSGSGPPCLASCGPAQTIASP